MITHARRRRRTVSGLALGIVSLLPACAATPLVQGVGLSSYDALAPSDGLLTKSRIYIQKEYVLGAKSISILPTAFPSNVAPTLSGKQRALVANAINRALCIRLSDRFRVLEPDEPTDLVVRATITKVTETNEVAAGISAIGSVGINFVDMGAPVPIPRIPIGLGDLSIEAEAVDSTGKQQAAMIWGRGATAFFSAPKASKVSDAYDLAAAFGDDFGSLLVKGRAPFGGIDKINLPSWQKINSAMGFAPKYAACEYYGRAPGIAGVVGDKIGLPPEWTDAGPPRFPQR